MGYSTDFYGGVEIAPPLNQAERGFLNHFAETRRMDRERGPYFVEGCGPCGQGDEPDVRDRNRPPQGQPGLRCHWVPNDDGSRLESDGVEKFYAAEEWMPYLIDHFLRPGAEASKTDDPQFAEFTFDHVLNGEIEAQGEDPEDKWLLKVEGNEVTVLQGHVVYGDRNTGSKCDNCGASFTRDEALSPAAEDERELGGVAPPQELFELDRGRAMAELVQAGGAISVISPHTDADELNALAEQALDAGIVACKDPSARIYAYPLSLSEPDPMIAIDPGQGPTLLGFSLKLRQREREDPVAFTVRMLEELVDEANALLAHRDANGARFDRTAEHVDRPAPADTPEAYISLTYTAVDIQDYAEEAGVADSIALARVGEWAKHIEETVARLCNELLTSVVQNGQP